MNISKYRLDKKKAGLRLNDLGPEVKKSLLNGDYTVYVDFGIKRGLFGFLRKSGRGLCVYTLDRQLQRAYPQQLRLLVDC